MSRRSKGNDSQRPGGTFLALPHVVLESFAWRSLSLRARAVLIEIARRHNGFNNGTIGAGQRDLADALGSNSCRDIGKALAELVERGFLDVGTAENRQRRLAREYRITWLPTGEPPHRKPATNEWRGSAPPGRADRE